MILDLLSIIIAVAVAAVSVFFLFYHGQNRSGLRLGSDTSQQTKQSQPFQAGHPAASSSGTGTIENAASRTDVLGSSCDTADSKPEPVDDIDPVPSSASDIRNPKRAAADPVPSSASDIRNPKRAAATHRRYAFAKPHVLPPHPRASEAEIWEVVSIEDATALLGGCPATSTICCGFFVPYADGMTAQRNAIAELAAAQPTGFVFASVDVKSASEVAAWAGIRLDSPLVRLLQPDGAVVADFRPQEVKQGALHRKVLSMATSIAKAAEPKLENIAGRFVGSLCNKPISVSCSKAGLEKMRVRGIEALQNANLNATEEMFVSLCQICEVPRIARVREVANLAKIIREQHRDGLLPFLDLSRRLAEQKLLGGTDPGAEEAHELLLDAVLCVGFDMAVDDFSVVMLSLHFVVNCFSWDHLREGLLPVVGKLVRSDTWKTFWTTSVASATRKQGAQEAAIDLLLNASVALRSASCRLEHECILKAAIDVLFIFPTGERINLAVGNLLVVGGTPEQAKRALQGQPLPSLRAVAAALFRGDLDGPDGCAFPVAWQPEAPAAAARGTNAPEPTRRPHRAPIPARHRGRGIGGG